MSGSFLARPSVPKGNSHEKTRICISFALLSFGLPAQQGPRSHSLILFEITDCQSLMAGLARQAFGTRVATRFSTNFTSILASDVSRPRHTHSKPNQSIQFNLVPLCKLGPERSQPNPIPSPVPLHPAWTHLDRWPPPAFPSCFLWLSCPNILGVWVIWRNKKVFLVSGVQFCYMQWTCVHAVCMGHTVDSTLQTL